MTAWLPFAPLRNIVEGRGGIGAVLAGAGIDKDSRTSIRWRKRWQRATRDEVIREEVADEFACLLRRLPHEIWDEWFHLDDDDDRMCEVRDCGRCDIKGHGLCEKHYTRWYRYGDAGVVKLPGPPQRPCSVKNCRRQHRSNGFCKFHLDRWVRAGRPEVLVP